MEARERSEEEEEQRPAGEEEQRPAGGSEEEEDQRCKERDRDGDGGDDDDDEEDEDTSGAERAEGRKEKPRGATSCPDRKCVPGIIYLGHIPPRLRPKHLRNLLSAHGEIGRIFLQPEDRFIKRLRRHSGSRRCDFTEGWVEFRDKRVAKRVAASLHNSPMGTRKRQRHAADLWCIKYLHRFQWTHLSERLAYEQSVLQQRLRTEVSQVKKESSFYLSGVERSRRQARRRGRGQTGVDERSWSFTQRQTEEEIQTRKLKKQKDKSRLLQQQSQSNVSLLAKIFNSNQSQ